MNFQPNDHLTQIKSKSGKSSDYLPVQWRLVWLREQCPEATIETEVVQLDLERQVAVFKCVISNGNAIATGHGSESARDFADYIEKAETKSIGRALAALGYGTQFAPELDEQPRIVDAPVERQAERPALVKDTGRAYPGTEHLTNGDGAPAFPAQTVAITRGDLFQRGEDKGLWNRMAPSKFYAMASAITGRPQSKADWTMTQDEMAEMARQIEAEPVASGK